MLLKRFCIITSLSGFSYVIYDMSRSLIISTSHIIPVIDIIVLVVSIVLLIGSSYKVGSFILIVILWSVCFILSFKTHEIGLIAGGVIVIMALSYKFDIFRTWFIQKILGTILGALLILVISGFLDGYSWHELLPYLIIWAISSIISILIFFEGLKFLIISKCSYHHDMDSLKNTLNLTRGYLKDMFISRVNPSSAGLSSAEDELLKALCLYGESNTDLGFRLKKSPNTIKAQFTVIMIKIGAESRYQLIDLCKFHYIEQELQQ